MNTIEFVDERSLVTCAISSRNCGYVPPCAAAQTRIRCCAARASGSSFIRSHGHGS